MTETLPAAAPDPYAGLDDRPLDAPPVDALLLVSFGGPEAPEDVLPFMENVTRGRGIPPERLQEVSRHYLDVFGGVSPINEQARALKAALEAELAERGPAAAGLLGQPQLAPVPGRHARRRCGPTACATRSRW